MSKPEKKRLFFWGHPSWRGWLPTITTLLRERILVIQGKPDPTVILVDLHTQEAQVINDIAIDKIISLIDNTKDLNTCIQFVKDQFGEGLLYGGHKPPKQESTS